MQKVDVFKLVFGALQSDGFDPYTLHQEENFPIYTLYLYAAESFCCKCLKGLFCGHKYLEFEICYPSAEIILVQDTLYRYFYQTFGQDCIITENGNAIFASKKDVQPRQLGLIKVYFLPLE